MVEISDPVVWSTIVQTAVLTLTLVVFIFSFRSQDKAIKEQAYQKIMDDYGDAMRMLSDRPELYAFQLELFNRSGRPLGQQKTFTRGHDHPQLCCYDVWILRENIRPLQAKMD